MAFGRLRGPRVRELNSSGSVLYSVQSTLPEAGGQSPGRVLGVTPWGPLAAAFAVAWAEHEKWLQSLNSKSHRERLAAT